MRARVGDRIILAAEHIDQPTRDGEVLEVRGDDGGPPYLVRWSDGHTGLIFPGPGTVLRIGAVGDVAATAPEYGHRDTESSAPVTYVREWTVRGSILERRAPRRRPGAAVGARREPPVLHGRSRGHDR